MLNQSTIWIALALYMCFLVAVAVKVTIDEKKNTSNGGNALTATVKTPVLIMTYIASLMSTWVFFAGPGAYYRGGLVYFISELSYICLFPIVAHFTINKVWIVNRAYGNKFVTPADFYDARFKSPVLRVVLAIIFLIASVPYIASVLVAIANACQYATGGNISYQMAVIVVGLIMTIFMMTGGTKSAATADMFQGLAIIAMLWFIVIAIIIVGFGDKGGLGGAFSQLWSNGSGFFSYPGPSGWCDYAGRFGYPFSCAIGWTIMLPHVFVRAGYFGDNQKSQRMLSIMGPVLQVIIWTGVMLIGLIGLALLPGLESSQSELIIPYMIQNIIDTINPGLAKGLMVAFFIGSMAVGLSTANAFLSVAAGIIYEDLIKHTFKIKVKHETAAIRIVIAIIGVGSLLFALNPPDLIFTLIMFAIAIVMPLLPILVFGIYWRKATKQAAILAAIVGSIIVLLTYFVWDLGGSFYGFFGLIASVIVMVVVSLITHQDEADSAEFFEKLKEGHDHYYIFADKEIKIDNFIKPYKN